MPEDELPTWEIVGPDDSGLVFLEWEDDEGSTSAIPLGFVGDVREQLAQWLTGTVPQ
jgi:hypothetical protein